MACILINKTIHYFPYFFFFLLFQVFFIIIDYLNILQIVHYLLKLYSFQFIFNLDLVCDMKNLKNNSVFYYQIAICLIGIFFRFYGATQMELWRDQAFSVRAASFPLQKMLSVVRKDTAPFLHYLILYGWTAIFGNSELSCRLPSILAGCLSIFVFRNVANKSLSDQRSKLIALSLYAGCPIIIMYDQMARVYSLVLLITLCLFSNLLDIIERTDNNITYVKICLLTALGLYGYNLFLIVGFINLLFFLHYSDNTRRIKIMVSYFFAGIIYLPLFITVTLEQFKVVVQSHLPFYLAISLFIIFTPMFSSQRAPSSASKIDGIVRIASFIIPSVILIYTIVRWCQNYFYLTNKNVKVLFNWMIGILILAYIYSMTKTTIASPRYLLFFAPIICLLYADLYGKAKSKVIYLLIIFCFFTSIYEGGIGYIYKGDMKAMIKDVTYNQKTLILAGDGISFHTLKFYIQYPVYLYDPNRKFPFYDGTAIFIPEDYYDHEDFSRYDNIYIFYFRYPIELTKKLQAQHFNLEFKKLYNGRQYNLQKWTKI